jgi:hypothetical protein
LKLFEAPLAGNSMNKRRDSGLENEWRVTIGPFERTVACRITRIAAGEADASSSTADGGNHFFFGVIEWTLRPDYRMNPDERFGSLYSLTGLYSSLAKTLLWRGR